jgi:protein-tyrosine kinase
MGRLDEALRRAATPASVAATVGATRDDPFTSPWGLDERGPAAAPEVQPLVTVATTASAASTVRDDLGTGTAVHPAGEAALVPATDRWHQRLAVSEETEPVLVEQFRRLAATLIHSQRTAPLKVVMVTSALPEEGKTLTAVNLALVLSGSFRRRVLLIDADLRHPKITLSVDATVDYGLGEAVKADGGRKPPLVQLTDTLTLLPAGRRDPDPLSGLTSARMQQLLQEASATFEWVIVDTPPIAAAADASLLCAMADATVLVVRAVRTPYEAIDQAIEGIGRERIIGVVLNGVETGALPSYGEYLAADTDTR